MTDLQRVERGILDTSVVVDIDLVDRSWLPRYAAISTITLAELTAGPGATEDLVERAVRQDRLQRAESVFEPLPVDSTVARAYGRVCVAIRVLGRQPRRRFGDLLIASTGLAHELPVFTRNMEDFLGLEDLLDVIEI